MEQLWAIWCCSRPRSYRRRSTSLILRMDRPFCGIQLLLWLEEKAEAGCPAPLFTPNRKHDPAMSISIRVRPASFAADIHIAGIRIHIRPESLFTSLRNPYSHRPEYAYKAGHSLARCRSSPRTLMQREGRVSVRGSGTRSSTESQRREAIEKSTIPECLATTK